MNLKATMYSTEIKSFILLIAVVVYTPARRSLSDVHYILPMLFFIFYGCLIIMPRLTEVRETFTLDEP